MQKISNITQIFQSTFIRIAVETIVSAFVNPENLLTLALRMVTIILVIAHYSFVEGIDYWNNAVRNNEDSFIKLILIWHLVFMMMRILDDRKMMSAHEQEKNFRIWFAVILIGIPSLIVILFTPILAWFNFKITHLETSYWTLRYLMMFFYILGNLVTSVF